MKKTAVSLPSGRTVRLPAARRPRKFPNYPGRRRSAHGEPAAPPLEQALSPFWAWRVLHP